MTEIEKIAYTKGFIDKLADGIDPLTGEAVPDGELVRNPRISKCFSYVSDILRRIIENGGLQTKDHSLPFYPGSLDRFSYSAEPISVTELAKKISAHKQDLRMENLNVQKIQTYLVQNGYLEIVPGEEKTSKKRVTELGRTIGLMEEIRSYTNASYTVILYSITAQQFVIRHMMEILAVQIKRKG
ncbi:MAG: hypothetical protein IJ242_02880 [Clostridia bacterium]|nr:hypothetical protein [Clostridia bacterium]